ncbi:MAG: hypothetical protein K1566_03725 [Candidatus Thiodiazotropha sp. (ex. Lucinisca nassula)]|nr:hypothetical protein [Candidatus Thiodiazotropha sp. (ex. Lucinisca nassula)]MBW9261464.1 hypothetical protein [Candidatus Thiodiazotropha sp. (ex. Lucinisca nassula)]MBW9268731.1 hypothetical protein [Candidatus Thiodiazotropha sp. (ex. Lucinisca nassula)]
MNGKEIHIDAQHLLLKALCSNTDPEQNRKIIGNLIIVIWEEEASNWRMPHFSHNNSNEVPGSHVWPDICGKLKATIEWE